jgi:hypothetical protein
MLEFFDYVYYKSVKFYSKTDKAGAGITGLSVMSLMHFCNIYSIFMVVCLLVNKNIDVGKLSVLALLALLLIANFIRYNKLTYGLLKERWDNEDKKLKRRKGWLVVLYICSSFIMCFGLAIYLGGKKW